MNNPLLNVRPLLLSMLLTIASSAAVQANPTHSVSEIIDGVEFKLETDKAIYEYGEVVQMTYSVTNHTAQTLGFVLKADSNGVGMSVRDSDEATTIGSCDIASGGCPLSFGIWMSGHPFITVPAFGWATTLTPDDTLSQSYNWNLRYASWTTTPNELVSPGNYIVSGSLIRGSLYQPQDLPPQDLPAGGWLSLEIEVIPEPASAVLLAAATCILARRKRR